MRSFYTPGGKLKIRRSAVVAAFALMTAALMTPHATAAPKGEPTLSEIAKMPAAEQARLLNPLRSLAGAVANEGEKHFANFYSNVYIDAPKEHVIVYVTDLAQGKELLRAVGARKRPGIAVRRAILQLAPYSHATLDAAAARIMQTAAQNTLPVHISAAAVAPDGSSVQLTETPSRPSEPVELNSVLSAQPKVLAAAAGVRLTVNQGEAPKPAAWSDVKWNDSKPFIAGDVLTDTQGSYVNYCSAGMSIVANGKDFLVTAAHCFQGADISIYTGGADKGRYDGDTTGAHYVGFLAGSEPTFDDEIIDSGSGNTSNSDESDVTSYLPMTSDAYSYNGDLVCQDGAASYFLGHGVPCSIKVVNQDIRYNIVYAGQTVTVRGVEGTKTDGGWAVHEGDSGGAVFSVAGQGIRQSRGIVSAEDSDGGANIFWTETPDILKQWYAKLNPVT